MKKTKSALPFNSQSPFTSCPSSASVIIKTLWLWPHTHYSVRVRVIVLNGIYYLNVLNAPTIIWRDIWRIAWTASTNNGKQVNYKMPFRILNRFCHLKSSSTHHQSLPLQAQCDVRASNVNWENFRFLVQIERLAYICAFKCTRNTDCFH